MGGNVTGEIDGEIYSETVKIYWFTKPIRK